MLSSYAIYIRDKSGGFRDRLVNITQLTLVEALNDVGSWTIKSRTPDACPFQAGDGIVVFRNGEYYYSGVMTSVKETYDGYNELYEWTASGQNDLVYLNWRILYPDPTTLDPSASDYYDETGPLGIVVSHLIDKNIGPDAIPVRRLAFLEPVYLADTGESVSVHLRFQTILETVSKLLNEQNFVILPTWNPNTRKLTYTVNESNDLSSMTIFSSALNQITQIDYNVTAPYNYILAGGQGELTERAFAIAQDTASDAEWGRIEFFYDYRSAEDSQLQSATDAYLEKSAQENVGWAADINSDDLLSRYRIDWNLGDVIGVTIKDRTIARRVLQVETSVTYDSETIKPTVGTIDRGSFDMFYEKMLRMRSDVNQLQWSIS